MGYKTLKIGMSARLYHPEAGKTGLMSKSLQYLEQSVAHWVMSRNVMVLMVPSILHDSPMLRSNIRLSDYAEFLDGLVLQGGADVSPHTYHEQAIDPRWQGDAVRDAYEMELLHEFVEAGKPVLGICRGMQLINVAYGGTLYQDIPTQLPQSLAHETPAYDQHHHAISFQGNGRLAACMGQVSGEVISIHHQAVKQLGRDIDIEATSADGVVEAISRKGRSFVCGVQWHPEFHVYHGNRGLLDCTPILESFLDAARRRR